MTLIAQRPRVNVEHAGVQVKSLMMENLARLLHVPLTRVNVKARTHEKVDAVRKRKAGTHAAEASLSPGAPPPCRRWASAGRSSATSS